MPLLSRWSLKILYNPQSLSPPRFISIPIPLSAIFNNWVSLLKFILMFILVNKANVEKNILKIQLGNYQGPIN
jgi:hypothetical protein